MESESFEEIRLNVDGLQSTHLPSSSTSSLCLCRICHEEEEQESTAMENPCACSGTLKFAHRKCIQRWCDLKRNVICEICLKKFEPDYTVTTPAPGKPRVVDVVITIRGSLEAARLSNESQHPAVTLISGGRRELESTSYSLLTYRSKLCFQMVAIMFTTMFFLRHLALLVFIHRDHYTITLSIVILRIGSVLLALYMIMHLKTSLWNIRRSLQFEERELTSSIYHESIDIEDEERHAQ